MHFLQLILLCNEPDFVEVDVEWTGMTLRRLGGRDRIVEVGCTHHTGIMSVSIFALENADDRWWHTGIQFDTAQVLHTVPVCRGLKFETGTQSSQRHRVALMDPLRSMTPSLTW
jgi:hypothetical protein